VRKVNTLVQPPSNREGQDRFYDREERLYDVENSEDNTDLPYEDEREDDTDDNDDDEFIYRLHDVEPDDLTDILHNIPEFDYTDTEENPNEDPLPSPKGKEIVLVTGTDGNTHNAPEMDSMAHQNRLEYANQHGPSPS
jgi:hypothetical protein